VNGDEIDHAILKVVQFDGQATHMQITECDGLSNFIGKRCSNALYNADTTQTSFIRTRNSRQRSGF